MVDCWGCRDTPARYCASCVSQAITERHEKLRSFNDEKRKMDAAMADGIAARKALLQQRETRRAHGTMMAKLRTQLDATRSETERLAAQVNSLRHAVRRSQASQLLPTAHTSTSNLHARAALQSSAAALDPEAHAEPDEAFQAALAGRAAAAQHHLSTLRHARISELLALHRTLTAQFDRSIAGAEADVAASDGAVNGSVGTSVGGAHEHAHSRGNVHGDTVGGAGDSPCDSAASSLTSSASSSMTLSQPSLSAHAPNDLSLAVLVLLRCAEHMGVTSLPHRLSFRGSDTLIWPPRSERALCLNSQHCTQAEWHKALRLLGANVWHVLDHAPEAPLSPPLSLTAPPPREGAAETRGSFPGTHPSRGEAAAVRSAPALRGADAAAAAIDDDDAPASARLSGIISSSVPAAAVAAAVASRGATAAAAGTWWLLRAAASSLAGGHSEVHDGGMVAGAAAHREPPAAPPASSTTADTPRTDSPLMQQRAVEDARFSTPRATRPVAPLVAPTGVVPRVYSRPMATSSDAAATAAAARPPSASSAPRCGVATAELAGSEGDGLVRGLATLLDAPTLAWELHPASCPLWSHMDHLGDDGAAAADEWAVVERPMVPPPDAQPEEIAEYEATACLLADAHVTTPSASGGPPPRGYGGAVPVD